MLNEKALLSEVHEDLIKHSAALRKVFQFEGGQLVQNGEKIDYIVNGKPMFITYIPYDYEGIDIDLRIRKRLAKEFLQLHTLESLKAEYIVELERKEAEEVKREEEYKVLQKDFETLRDILKRFKNAECRQYASYNLIHAEYDYKDIYARVENKHTKLEIRIENGIYKAEYSYCGDRYTTSTELTEGTLEEVKAFILNAVYPIMDGLKSAADARIKVWEEEQAKENAIKDVVKDIRMGDNWYVLKSKRTYTAICGSTKYSLKGEGKYQKPNYSKILEDIKNGKIESYAVVPNGEWADRNTYKDLEYIPFNKIA